MTSSVLQRLLEQGYVTTRLGPNEELLVIPQHLELFARAGAYELSEAARSAESFDEAYRLVVAQSAIFPLGDIVGAQAAYRLWRFDARRFSEIATRALHDVPDVQVLEIGTVLEVSRFGRVLGEIELDEPSTLTGNIHPWLLLAQLAVLPLSGAGSFSPNGQIIATVGSYPGLLRRTDDGRWRALPGFHMHDIPGKGSASCFKNGVVEPVVEAMINGFLHRPKEMRAMAEHAIGDDHFHLAWRLHTASREMESSTDSGAASAASDVKGVTEVYFDEHWRDLKRSVDLEREPRAAERVTESDGARTTPGRRPKSNDERRRAKAERQRKSRLRARARQKRK